MSEFKVYITEDNLKVLLTCEIPPGDIAILVKRIQRELGPLGLGRYFKVGQLEEWLRNASQKGTRLNDALLIEGKESVPPVDGKIEWAKDFFSNEFLFDEKTGAIDYRQRVAQSSVDEGEHLAHLVKAKKGENGLDVFGRQLKVEEPNYARITAGKNVRFEPETCDFFATAQGRIHWADEGVSVDPVYHIRGNVGLDSGDVSHPGAVVVEGDVEEGATVKADGDVEIKGVLESVNIETDGDLTVRGGITGSENTRIKVKGSVRAKFILDADLEVQGDVVVEKEIIHSHVKLRGAVKMPKGRMVGGKIIALGSVTAGQIGSDALVPTSVTAGDDYWLPIEIDCIEDEISSFEQNLARINETVEPFKSERSKLDSDKKEIMRKLLADVPKIKKSIEKKRNKIKILKQNSRERQSCRIIIGKIIYSESVLCLGKEILRLKETYPGSSRAVLNKGRVELIPG